MVSENWSTPGTIGFAIQIAEIIPSGPDLVLSSVCGYVGKAEAADETERPGNDPALTQAGARPLFSSEIGTIDTGDCGFQHFLTFINHLGRFINHFFASI